jgi:hypothetical protein
MFIRYAPSLLENEMIWGSTVLWEISFEEYWVCVPTSMIQNHFSKYRRMLQHMLLVLQR